MSVSKITSWLKEPLLYLQTSNFENRDIIIVLHKFAVECLQFEAKINNNDAIDIPNVTMRNVHFKILGSAPVYICLAILNAAFLLFNF